MSQPQSTKLMQHARVMIGMSGNIHLLKIANTDDCPEAAAAWARVMSVLETEAYALQDAARLDSAVVTALAGKQE